MPWATAGVLAAGCGGESRRADFDGSNALGGANTAGTAQGGARGGSAGAGGSPSGASGGGGNTGGVSGAAGAIDGGGAPGGAGQTGNDACALPVAPGPCEAAIPRIAFDSATGLCLPFFYGGCEGNANNFETVEHCYAECGGQGSIDPALCGSSPECVVTPTTCCGECLEPTITNVVAVRRGQETAVLEALGCRTEECNPCDAPAPNPWLSATCRAGRCVAFDARQTELTACAETDDCRLRAGLDCCESCSPALAGIVALNVTADLGSWTCAAGDTACTACMPSFPAGASAACADGRCSVVSQQD